MRRREEMCVVFLGGKYVLLFIDIHWNPQFLDLCRRNTTFETNSRDPCGWS